jgi:hypothetical protein
VGDGVGAGEGDGEVQSSSFGFGQHIKELSAEGHTLPFGQQVLPAQPTPSDGQMTSSPTWQAGWDARSHENFS